MQLDAIDVVVEVSPGLGGFMKCSGSLADNVAPLFLTEDVRIGILIQDDYF